MQEAYSAASFAAYSLLSDARMERLIVGAKRMADALITRILRRQMTKKVQETLMEVQTHHTTHGKIMDTAKMQIQTQIKPSKLFTNRDIVKCQCHHIWANLRSNLIQRHSSNNFNQVLLSLTSIKTAI